MYFSCKQKQLGFIYNTLTQAAQVTLKVIAPFNDKINLGVIGRSNTFSILKSNLSPKDKTLWFHCASLGEYEQGLPVFKELRQLHPNHKIVLSFFSPSGYEIRKKTKVADIVVYLPLDTKQNAREFLNLVNPELTVFVKYDFWPNFLNELKSRKRRTILISALFRPNQSFFKFYGKSMRSVLFAFEHIFVQNEESKQLLKTINYNEVTVSGDTRFDRVSQQLEQNNKLEFIEEFKQNSLCVVAGSTWPEDEAVLIDYINNNASDKLKFIIAPHNINASQITKLKKALLTPTVLFSEKENKQLSSYKVLILDTIGLLSKVYNYADIAYVGGGMGKTGLHNTLEPATFGVPIIIGQHFKKFPEASNMITIGGMFSIKTKKEIDTILGKLVQNKDYRLKTGALNLKYIKKNTGSVVQIINFTRK